MRRPSRMSSLVERLEPRQLLSGTIFGVTLDNRLVQFDSDNPSLISNPQPITGLAKGEEIVGIDIRPATNELYGLSKSSRIYKINPQTASATPLAGGVQFSPRIKGVGYDLDFDPKTDTIRVITNVEQNLRINPDTGEVTEDDRPFFSTADVASGVDPNVSGLAYSNNFAGTGTTTLYGIDTGTDTLVTVGTVGGVTASPNLGRLFTVGALGVDVQFVGFDIGLGSGGTAYAAVTPNQKNPETQLYTVNLTTGAASLVGTIGAGGLVREIAVAPASVSFEAAVATAEEDEGSVTVTVRRTSGSDGPMTIDYATADGSAVAGQDYTAESGTLSFADGEEEKTISVSILNDATLEGLETFSIVLSNPSGGTLLVAPATNVVTIGDDDPGVVLVNDNGIPTLQVIGTTGNDVIRFIPQKKKQVEVLLNNNSLGIFPQAKELLVVGREGNDDILLGKYNVPARIFGGEGDDLITGGKKSDALIGGPGADRLLAGGGKDLLIGGDGLDDLNGGKGPDLIVAGPSTYDTVASNQSVRTLLGQWAGKGSLKKKWAVLSNGQSQLGAGQAFDDAFADGLIGEGGTDAFYANTTGGGTTDTFFDRTTKETPYTSELAQAQS